MLWWMGFRTRVRGRKSMNFGNNLRKLIEEREMTQKELAKQLNIAPSTLGSYVQSAREPDFATLILLADFFDVSPDKNTGSGRRE